MQTFDPDLLDFLESRVVPEWQHTVWREVLGHSTPLHPNQRGARWNPPGVEALYCSLAAATASAEVDFLISLQSVPIRKRRLVSLLVEITRVVDLTDTSPLVSFGIDRPDLWGDNHDAPRLIGSAVSWLSCAGLLVPSARHEGTNLVIYTNQMAATDRVALVDTPDVDH